MARLNRKNTTVSQGFADVQKLQPTQILESTDFAISINRLTGYFQVTV